IRNWQNGAQIKLYYNRPLTVGTPEKPGLISIAEQKIRAFREQLDDLQAAFTLVHTPTGEIFSQYGGDAYVDMALRPKPVVGSVFKVLTYLIAEHWPEKLPLINSGRSAKHRRRFFYHDPKFKGHWVRNSHKMPPFVQKPEALAISANIAFVFLSLRWTWMLDPPAWKRIFRRGLKHLLEDRRKMTFQEAEDKIAELEKDPVALRRYFVKWFGYQPFFRNLREEAVFEAAKVATIKALFPQAARVQAQQDQQKQQQKQAEQQKKAKRTIDQILADLSAEKKASPTSATGSAPPPGFHPPTNPTAPTPPAVPPLNAQQLVQFLSTDLKRFSVSTLHPELQKTFLQYQQQYRQKFQGPTSLEELGWSRELRMEMGDRKS
ncbi:MAG: hypothetical protein AAGJ35_14170, partial [Myxococcota bacterium]